MTATARLVLAVVIVAVDLVLVVVPLTGLLAAYLILVRPPWFQAWVERLYQGSARATNNSGGP
jgi:hypothetical protein